ncbi:MAG: LytTR family transcriptional regulator DNA-binding domain-containing protein [Saprospiraceae bacterium]|nr:LytTR family transcriptional regulator DNA-binding domain-containing protein [Saprospiraceae bacterium]
MKVVKMVPISEYVTLKMEVDRLTAMVTELTGQLQETQQLNTPSMDKGVFIWSEGKSTFVRIKDIVMMKAESNYSVIYLNNGLQFFTSHTLKYWVEKCKVPQLIRTHKSYVVNYRNVVSIDQHAKTILLEGGHIAPFSRSAKKLISEII